MMQNLSGEWGRQLVQNLRGEWGHQLVQNLSGKSEMDSVKSIVRLNNTKDKKANGQYQDHTFNTLENNITFQAFKFI